jgi:hypothetical protein
LLEFPKYFGDSIKLKRKDKMEFNKNTLIEFEREFYTPNGKYKHQRYGQALNNVFDFDFLFGEFLFHEADDSHSRMIAWMALNQIKEN